LKACSYQAVRTRRDDARVDLGHRIRVPSAGPASGDDKSGLGTRQIHQGDQAAEPLRGRAGARELRGLNLCEALDLVALIAQVRPDRLEPAAIRWHGRLEIEAKSLTLAESRFALAAFERLPHDPQLAECLRRLLRRASPTTLRPLA
jgi:hypothetical protein